VEAGIGWAAPNCQKCAILNSQGAAHFGRISADSKTCDLYTQATLTAGSLEIRRCYLVNSKASERGPSDNLSVRCFLEIQALLNNALPTTSNTEEAA
jgi:hypothetical protein